MGKVILHVCDSCDARDRMDDASVPRHAIEPVRVLVHVGAGDDNPKQYAHVMLCTSCRDALDSAILGAITQKPCVADEPIGRSL